MKVSIIETHSFVDLITNSSSEVFVCNTDKSLDFVKGALTFTYGYKEPFVFPIEVGVLELPEKLAEKLKKYSSWQNAPWDDDDWWEKRREAHEEAVLFFLSKLPNSEEAIKKYKEGDWGRYGDNRDEEIARIITLIDEVIGYGFDIPKGSIIIESKDDNSIPYDDWNRINRLFNAKNYHLG